MSDAKCLSEVKYMAHKERDRAERYLDRAKGKASKDYLTLAFAQYDAAIRSTKCADAIDALCWANFNFGRATGR